MTDIDNVVADGHYILSNRDNDEAWLASTAVMRVRK